MRRLLFLILGGLAALVFAAGPALADSPHFMKTSASVSSTTGVLTVNFKEAGLGSQITQATIVASASASATYLCVNGGGNHPKATNKQSVNATVSNSGTFPVRNGQTTGFLTLSPPPAGPFTPPCSPPMTVQLAAVSYTNVMVTDADNGDTTTIPGTFSACLPIGAETGVC
jgi:hypothetical protein